MGRPLLELRSISREYVAGDQKVIALQGLDLSIEAGEMVAIVGASGSGKSTLLNLLGCLDRPTAGSYVVAGHETSGMSDDERAQLRRERFGFVFQRYHLLPDLSALENVETPAIYTGRSQTHRTERAQALLAQLGLGDRLHHRPSQLSGGQQQRVAIARALMNDAQVILADEPTGALDSRSSAELMDLLRGLNAEGRTVVLITHDPRLAAIAPRVIEISDGRIVADRRNAPAPAPAPAASGPLPGTPVVGEALRATRGLIENVRMALHAMNMHRGRTILTALGIIIGIASVVAVVGLGRGSRDIVLEKISSIGTDTVEVYPGRGPGDEQAPSIRTLTPADADAIAAQAYVRAVTPMAGTTATVRVGSVAATATISGVGEQFFDIRDIVLGAGRLFDGGDVERAGQVAVIDEATRRRLFGSGDAVGREILLGDVPVRVVGVTARRDDALSGGALNVYVPYTAVLSRMLGQAHLRNISVALVPGTPGDAAASAIDRLLVARHRADDTFTYSTDSIRQAIEGANAALTGLVAMVAAITLLVGGIGVMNIMLVSVTERTVEIGVRRAMGARRQDILQQFLVEASALCLGGGALGVLAALLVSAAINAMGLPNARIIISAGSIGLGFCVSTLIGVTFGYAPARRAARLDPALALSRQ